jgi:hypothetical protein
MNTRIFVAALAAGALAVPAAAVAHPGHGKVQDKHSSAKAHGKSKQPKKVMFVFKGTFMAPGTLDVVSGNSHVRKGGFVGHAVNLDATGAKVVAADTNADSQVDITDVKDGDVVLVQVRAARKTQWADGADALVARKIVDRTNAPVEDDSTDTADEAPAAS